MRILIINNVYKIGSTGKIVSDTKNYYENQGHHVMVAYGMGKDLKEPHTLKFCTSLERYAHYYLCKVGYNPLKGSPLAVRRIARAIKGFNPDIIHVHCMNSHCVNLYGLLDYLSKNEYKVVITHHAEFYYTGSCPHAYDCVNWINSQCMNCLLPKAHKLDLLNINHHVMWQKMYNCFSGFKKENLVFTAVSPWVKKRAELSPITNKFDCITVMNGIDTNIFHFNKDKSTINKGKYAFVAFHASASFTDKENDPKGGKYIIELANLNPSFLFVVAALHISTINKLPQNVLIWGAVNSGVKLAKLYSDADITIISSRRETFSMIIAESLCCGTPVVGFEAGGPESISIQEYTEYVEYGNVSKLNEVMHATLKKKYNKKEIALQAMSLYSKENMSSRYLKIYKDLLFQ